MGAGPAREAPRYFRSRAQWRSWLKRHHGRDGGLWLVIARKHASGLHYEEAVEEALCFGWIDSTVRRLDDDRYRQWYSPRKPGGNWSKINKERVRKLIREGLMDAAGLAVIEQAKADGSWESLDAVESLEMPDDLREAIELNEKAGDTYDRLAPSHKKQYLYWINSAKRPETRSRRIRETVDRLEQGRKPGD